MKIKLIQCKTCKRLIKKFKEPFAPKICAYCTAEKIKKFTS